MSSDVESHVGAIFANNDVNKTGTFTLMVNKTSSNDVDQSEDRVAEFGLETLEQRIVLSGDISLASVDDRDLSETLEVVDEQVTADVTVVTSPLSPDPVSNLTIIGSSGSESVFDAANLAQPIIIGSGQTLTGKGIVSDKIGRAHV